METQEKPKPFRLVRYFSLISAVVIGLAMIGTFTLLQKVTATQLVEDRETANVALAKIVAGVMWSDIRDYVNASAGLDGDTLRAHPMNAEFQEAIRGLLSDVTVVKVKVYALDGTTVFSTEESQMGDNKAGNSGFLTAAAGQPASGFSNRDRFSAFSKEVFDVDIVTSYLPIFGRNGAVEGVFEVYDDVTKTHEKLQRRNGLIIAAVGSLFMFLYLALLLVVRSAARIMTNQHSALALSHERVDQANAALLARNRELDLSKERLEFEIDARKEVEEKLKILALTDWLTDLPNRRAFVTRIDVEKARLARDGGSVGVILLDIDHFKHVNDTYGHDVGDMVLKATALLLIETARAGTDMAVRIGGEEFLVLLPDLTLAETTDLAERFRSTLAEFEIGIGDGKTLSITASFGVTVSDDPELTADILLKEADHALYEAKSSGRNTVRAFDRSATDSLNIA